MSIDEHLIHTCTIERPYRARTNAHGLGDDLYKTIAETQACRMVIKDQRMAASQTAEQPVVTLYLLLLPANADLAQGDRITAVTFETGQTMVDGFRVTAILPRRARSQRHISAKLERVS